MDSFFVKYLKYKNKYLKIKKQVGGMRKTIVKHKHSGKSISISLPDFYFSETGELRPIHNILVKEGLEKLINDAFFIKEREILSLEEKAFIKRDPQAKYELALKYLSGEDFLEKNVDIALELLKEASSVGHLPSRSLLESMNPSAFIFSSDATFPIYNPYQIDVSVQKIKKLTKQCIDYPGFKKGPHMDKPTNKMHNEYCNSVGSSLTSTEVTEKIVEHVGKDCVLSLAAGRAAQETLLAARGVKIVCTDINPPENPWMPVERLDNNQAVAKWRPQCEIAMLVWPERIETSSCHTYKAVLEGNFQKIIIIGEDHGGCTGSEILDDFLYQNYKVIGKERLLNWPGINDSLEIWERLTDKVMPSMLEEESKP